MNLVAVMPLWCSFSVLNSAETLAKTHSRAAAVEPCDPLNSSALLCQKRDNSFILPIEEGEKRCILFLMQYLNIYSFPEKQPRGPLTSMSACASEGVTNRLGRDSNRQVCS